MMLYMLGSKLRIGKSALAILLPSMMIGALFLAPNAFAATGQGQKQTTPEIDGHFYVYYTTIATYPNAGLYPYDVEGAIVMRTEYEEEPPANYMEAQSWLINQTTEAVVATSGRVDSPGGVYEIIATSDEFPGTPGDSRYADDTIWAYNGAGYDEYQAVPSPILVNNDSNSVVNVNNGSTMSPSAPAFPTNADGQTYGSLKGFPPSEWPDLVLVQDTAGQVGYAYASQLYSQPTTLPTAHQAEAQNARLAKGYTISVYDSNGTTLIGRFEVGGTAPTFIPPQTAGK